MTEALDRSEVGHQKDRLTRRLTGFLSPRSPSPSGLPTGRHGTDRHLEETSRQSSALPPVFGDPATTVQAASLVKHSSLTVLLHVA